MQGSYFKPDVGFFSYQSEKIVRFAIRQHGITEADIALVSIYLGNGSPKGYVTLENGNRLTVD